MFKIITAIGGIALLLGQCGATVPSGWEVQNVYAFSNGCGTGGGQFTPAVTVECGVYGSKAQVHIDGRVRDYPG